MTFRKTRALVTLLLFVTAGGLSVSPLHACPQETVTYPPFTVRQLSGKIEPPGGGDGLLPTEEIEFLIREKGKDKFEREVTVQPDGTFIIGLPEGTYEFRIKAKEFLFTLVGEVNVSLDASPEASMTIRPPWC